MCMCCRQLGVASRLWWERFDRAPLHKCYDQAVLQRFDRSAAAVQREFDVERSEIAAVRLKRAQHVDRRRRLGTAAALAPPQLAGSWMTSGTRPATAP